MKNPQPVADRVLVEPIAPNEKTESGLYLPTETKQVISEGYIRALGGSVTEPVQVGDKVLFRANAGTLIDLEGKKHRLIRESDLEAII